MQDARGSKQKERTEKRTPTHPRTTGKTQGKHGKGNPPTQREETPGGKGEGKRGKGNPTNPERNRKAPLDAERKSQKRVKIAWGKHLLELIQREEVQAQQRPARAQPVVEKKNKNNKNKTPKSCRQSVLLNLVVLKTTVIVTMHPHPGTPKQRRQRTLQGRSLKGSRTKIEVPKHQTFLNFPNTMPKP